ncbi:MAG TPA: trehalase family glycosidase [Candidatus Limiplasma sp.]|nr:trehalase family glycosidase [Candidatus Limiplasma sp.]
MKTISSSVRFQTDDALLQRLYNSAEQKLKNNLKEFAGRRVLIEGGGYQKIWLETQPMGGEMYAKRDMEAALNNQLLFMEQQRTDGRLPGSITVENGKIVPQFNKIQGFCFPAPALNLYYWIGKDEEYLQLLYHTLECFDSYLWAERDSDGDGCLESWCVYDTGEDNAKRYGDAPCWWTASMPPTGYDVVPINSMDFMSYSYSARDTLAKISAILQTDKKDYWKQQAKLVADKMRSYLWDDQRGACFDRDKHGKRMPALLHNNLRCMYWGSFSQEMADRFVREHLLNPEEFWTPFPLPSVAINDPLYDGASDNSWSGQPQGLTWQRAIRALENYGYQPLVTKLGHILFEVLQTDCIFPQQFDPYTGRRQGNVDGYGPVMLSVLEYISRMYGVHLEGEELWWSIAGGLQSVYTQQWAENTYTLQCDGKQAEAKINGKTVWKSNPGCRIVTDYSGNIIRRLAI